MIKDYPFFKVVVVLFVLVFINLGVYAQEDIKINPNRMLEWTFKEKVKFSPEQFMRIAEGQGIDYHSIVNRKLQDIRGEDMPVSDGPEIESEIHAAINPADSNNIVVSPIRMDMSAGAISCPVFYTNNFGDTWQESNFVNMPHVAGLTSGGGGDPVFAYDADGKLYFTWIDLYGETMDFLFGTVNMGIFWAYSDDGGANWTVPANDTILLGQLEMSLGQISSVVSPVSDKQWMAVDMSNSANRNNLYVSYVQLSQEGQNATYQILCKTKPADSDAFNVTAAPVSDPGVFSFVQFASISVDNTGNVHVVFYGTNNGTTLALWHSVSVDGGGSFSTPNKISNVKFNLPILQVEPYDHIPGIDDNRLYPCPYTAADQTNGNLYSAWTAFGIDSDAGTASDIYFSRSVDNGTSWSAPIIINDDPAGVAHNYYSAIFCDQSGKVSVSWYDRRDDPANNETHYYLAESFDGGASFTENVAVTSVATDFSTVGSQNQNFGIGEYNQILSTPTGYNTIPVWADGRGNDGDMNVYYAILNGGVIGIESVTSVTGDFYLEDVYPNPVSESAVIYFVLNEPTEITLRIVDNTGRLINVPEQGYYLKGRYSVEIDCTYLANGQYYYILNTEYGYSVKTLIIRK